LCYYATIVFALGLVAMAAYRYAAVTGPERRARLASLTAAVAFGLVVVGAIARPGRLAWGNRCPVKAS
jgi:hypothetical protein